MPGEAYPGQVAEEANPGQVPGEAYPGQVAEEAYPGQVAEGAYPGQVPEEAYPGQVPEEADTMKLNEHVIYYMPMKFKNILRRSKGAPPPWFKFLLISKSVK